MARRLRFNGTGSGGTGCPSLHEDLESREVIVHGPPLSDPEDVAQLHHLSEGEVAVVVPRELLVDYAPRDVTRAARIIDLDEFENLFRTFKHTAWRLETRRRYASDEITDTYRQFAETGSVDWDLEDPYCAMIRAQTEQESGSNESVSPTTRRPPASFTSSTTRSGTPSSARTSEVCGGPTRHGSACRKRTSGSLTRESWHG